MTEPQVGAAVLRSSLLVADFYQEVAADLGLTAQQALILVRVRRSPTNMRGLGRRLRLGKSTMTGVVARMIDAGLLVRSPDPDDRRNLLVSAAQRGEELADELLRRVPERIRELLAPLDPDERATLGRLLDRVLDADDARDGRLLSDG